MKSNSPSYIISFICVIVFCGLAVWDNQKLKRQNEEVTGDEETKLKPGKLGSLRLYLNFINLNFSLLRLFGNRKK